MKHSKHMKIKESSKVDIRKHRFVPNMSTSSKMMKSQKDKERDRERRDWKQKLRNGDYDDYDESTRKLDDSDINDIVYSILNDGDYCAEEMIAEIGELVDAESTGLGAEIYKVITDDELSAQGMVSELEDLIWRYEEDDEFNESIKDYDESDHEDWFGIKSAKFIYHGDWSDPEVQYDGVSLNYYDVEAILLDEYREEHPEDKNDKGFDDWMRMPEQKSSIQSALDILVQGGCGEPIDDEYEEVDESLKDSLKKGWNSVKDGAKKIRDKVSSALDSDTCFPRSGKGCWIWHYDDPSTTTYQWDSIENGEPTWFCKVKKVEWTTGNAVLEMQYIRPKNAKNRKMKVGDKMRLNDDSKGWTHGVIQIDRIDNNLLYVHNISNSQEFKKKEDDYFKSVADLDRDNLIDEFE